MSGRRLPTTGRCLQLLALGHAAVGAVAYRRELRQIGRRGLLGSVGFRGDRSSAFWFLMPSPLLWGLGRLMHRAELAGDADAVRAASRTGLATAIVGAACMPVSGFWLLIGLTLRGLREAARLGRG